MRRDRLALAASNVVAGIDPGTRRAGFCALRAIGQDLELLVMESFRVFGATAEERLFNLDTRLTARLESFRPGLVAVEGGYVGSNPSTSLAVGEARGVAIAAAWRSGAVVKRVSPREARAAIGIGGRQEARARVKQQVLLAVTRLLRPASAPDEDAADAAPLAVWAANRLWQLNRTGS